MAKFLDYDALRGVTEYEDRTDDGRLQIKYEQDVEPVLDLCRAERNSGLGDTATKKADMHLYARIPPVVILEMKHKYGVDIFSRDKGHMQKAVKLIETEYPYLKSTNKKHSLRG